MIVGSGVAKGGGGGGQGGTCPLENLVPPCAPHLRYLHLSLHLSLSSGAPHQTAVSPLCPPPPQNKKSGDATDSRLRLLNLTSLELRRLRGDLIQVYKIVHGFVNLSFSDFFRFANSKITRGHCLKLHKVQSQWRNQTFSFGGGGAEGGGAKGWFGGQAVVTLSKRSATIGWRVAYNKIVAKYTS